MSRTWNGANANGDSFEPSLSGDGRYVAFHTAASNIVAGDSNGLNEIIVHDRLTGASAPVSVTPTGAHGNNHSFRPGITVDGKVITFASRATNIIAGKTSTRGDAIVSPNPLW